jgi:hypothetical protein
MHRWREESAQMVRHPSLLLLCFDCAQLRGLMLRALKKLQEKWLTTYEQHGCHNLHEHQWREVETHNIQNTAIREHTKESPPPQQLTSSSEG